MKEQLSEEDVDVLGIVMHATFKVRVNRSTWEAMDEEERREYVYESAEEFGVIDVTYQEPMSP